MILKSSRLLIAAAATCQLAQWVPFRRRNMALASRGLRGRPALSNSAAVPTPRVSKPRLRQNKFALSNACRTVLEQGTSPVTSKSRDRITLLRRNMAKRSWFGATMTKGTKLLTTSRSPGHRSTV